MKYHMGIWKELPAYPTEEDVIFELNSYLVRDGRPNGDFSMQTFNSFLPGGWESSKHGEIINDLIKKETFITQKAKGGKTLFKIKNNPHY